MISQMNPMDLTLTRSDVLLEVVLLVVIEIVFVVDVTGTVHVITWQ